MEVLGPDSQPQSSGQLEIRFSDLTVTYKTPVASPTQTRSAKPYSTIGSVLKDAVMPPKTQHREVLKGVSGVLRPGTMTLVLGQPGSGKSTFLKALSGQLRPSGNNVRITGSVTYNGEPQHGLTKQLPQLAVYVPQQDQHFSMLTVQETFAYAKAFNSRGGRGTNTDDLSVIQAQLGLHNCWNTIVGDGMARGVSGGEKKRVTTGEMLFGDHRAAFMDEISTGLDSVTTFDIVNAQRVLARSLGKTVVISLLQPTPEVFALFDDVIVFHDGEVMYYGPTDAATTYFHGVGLECPPGANVADFLLDIGTAQQRKYERHLTVPRTSTALADHFLKSDQHHDIQRRIESPWDPVLQLDGRSLAQTPAFQQSVWANALTIAHRQLKLLLRDTVTLRSRAILVLVIAVFNATTFLDGDPTNAPATLGGVFAATMFLAFEQTSQLAALQTMREVFYKQRGASFFQTSAYVIGNTLSQIAMVVVEAVVFGTMVYWITGYEADAAQFFIFLLVLILSTMAAVLTFFCVTAAAPSVYFTVPAGLAVLQVILGFSGLVIPRSQIPDYLVWLFWINPITWSYRALAVNHYRSAVYDVCVFDGVDYCSKYGSMMSEYYLEISDVPTGREWIVYGGVYLLGYIIVLMAITTLLLEYKRYDAGSPSGGAPLVSGEPSEEGSTSEEDATGEYGLATTPRNSVMKIPVGPKHRACAPVTLAFKDLWYSVPNPQNPGESIDLLKGVTGFARPGTITALMGSSGAGKTTLLDVIAGRKNTGTITGDILLNGHAATTLAMRRATGYCEQTGIHSATATVREALTFSAFLRQGSDVPDSAKYDSVDECLELLGLDNIANHLAGSLSLEQSKRLTIGVELAAQPSVLFLDEPTSGLDARSAKLIMDSIRSVADSGRTIICTIHQPSLDVFAVFDSLLLLQRGGQTVFFGDLTDGYRSLVTYFEAMPSVAPLPTGYNPATWMLECIGAGVEGVKDQAVNFAAAFQQSELKQALETAMEEEGVGRPSAAFAMLAFESTHAATGATQMKFLLMRFINMYWRTPAHYVTMFGTALGAVIVFGITAIGLDTSSYAGLMAALGVMFVAHEFQSYVSFNSAIPFAMMDRAAFYREQSAHTYHTVWYWLGMTLAEIPYVFTKGLIVAVGLFLFMGFTGFGKFVLFWLASSLGMLVDLYMGQLLAYLLPTMVVATLMGSVVGAMVFIYIGFLPPGGSIPSWYQWFYTINPLRYGFPTLAALVYSDCPTDSTFDDVTGMFTNVGSQRGCQPLKGAPASFGNGTVKMFVETEFNMKHDDIGRNFGVLILCAVLLRVATLLAMRFLNHQKR